MTKFTSIHPSSPQDGTTGSAGTAAGGVGEGAYPVLIGVYRKRAGLTQAAMARRIGCSREHLSRIERRKEFLTERMERRIAHLLNLSNDDHLRCFGYPTRPSSTVCDDDKEAGGAAAPIDLGSRRLSRVIR